MRSGFHLIQYGYRPNTAGGSSRMRASSASLDTPTAPTPMGSKPSATAGDVGRGSRLSGGRSNCKFRSEEGAEYWIYTDLEGERFQWLGGDEEPAATAFAVGAKVQGMYPTGRYYSATVAEVHDGGAAYTLNWDDGDTAQRRKPANKVRCMTRTETSTDPDLIPI